MIRHRSEGGDGGVGAVASAGVCAHQDGRDWTSHMGGSPYPMRKLTPEENEGSLLEGMILRTVGNVTLYTEENANRVI